MPRRLTFTAGFNYTPSKVRAVTICYPAGRTFLVNGECAALALAKGKAIPAERPI